MQERANSDIAAHDTSQHGEAKILADLYQRAGIHRGMAIEFGAWDGKHLSNAYPFIVGWGWRGIMIEADPKRFVLLKQTYMHRPDVTCLDTLVEPEGENALDAILDAAGIGPSIDLLSIDIDGFDYQILATLRRRPRALVIEYNPTFPAHVHHVQPASGRPKSGSSIRALADLAASKGLALHAATSTNLIFVDVELADEHGIATHDPASAFAGNHLSYLCQAYDGTLLLYGNNSLLWHGLPMDRTALQVLPRLARRFPGDATIISRAAYWLTRQYYRLRGRKP